MEGDLERLSCFARNGLKAQGKKVEEGRCGIKIEAQPCSGQTCRIEFAPGCVHPEIGRIATMVTIGGATRECVVGTIKIRRRMFEASVSRLPP